MRRHRKTKILATIGPSSNTPEMKRALFDAGVDVFRINMSHTSHDSLAQMHKGLRDLASKVGRPIGILVDLQGPKIRLGSLPGGKRMLMRDERVRLVLGETSDKPDEIPIPHAEIFQAIKQKHALLIDDGRIRLRLLRRADTFAEAIVEVGGEIRDRKGRQHARHAAAHVGDDAQGPQRPGRGAQSGRGLDRAELCAAARRRGRTEKNRGRPRRRAGQDRKAQGAGQSGPDLGAGRLR